MKGYIYKIYHKDFKNYCYYGSTTNKLNVRLNKHKTHSRMFLNGKCKKYLRSYEILELDKIKDNYKNIIIEQVEEVICNNRKDLFSKELEYILNDKKCVNMENKYF